MRTSTLEKEGPLQVSRFVKIPVLLDADEMREMLEGLRPFSFYFVQGICGENEGEVSLAQFCESYGKYVEGLKEGREPVQEELRRSLAPVMSGSEEGVYRMEVGPGRFLIKPCRPVVQFQPNFICYAPAEKEFKTLTFGQETISWGVVISYPFLYQDNKTHEIWPTQGFPNAGLFRGMQRWLRERSRVVAFFVEGERVQTSIRLGLGCASWIARHPQLARHHLRIHL